MASSGSTDVSNRNSPATPPNTLNLRSSHNELLNAEIKHPDVKNNTPPKCRKKYALTNIQAAMGLSDPAAQPLLGSGSANIKLVKNGENQLRKAAEQGQQDPNKNVSPTATVIHLTSEKFESKEAPPLESSGCDQAQPRRTKSFLNYYADLETSAREFEHHLGNHQEVLDEKAPEDQGPVPTILGNGDLLLQKPSQAQGSPEDGQIATVSSSPETKKDHPKTGAKTDCALHRIQNLAPSDEESSWTTLSQDSASPSSPDETGNSGEKPGSLHGKVPSLYGLFSNGCNLSVYQILLQAEERCEPLGPSMWKPLFVLFKSFVLFAGSSIFTFSTTPSCAWRNHAVLEIEFELLSCHSGLQSFEISV